MKILISHKIIGFFFYIFIIAMGFSSTGNGFYNNYNLTMYMFFILLPLFFIYYRAMLEYLDVKLFFLILLMLFLFSISSFITPFQDKFQVWSRLLGIIACILLGFFSNILLKDKKISFDGINKSLVLIGVIHVFVLLLMWVKITDPFSYNWVESLYFFTNIRHLSDLLSICYFSSVFLFFLKNKYYNFLYLIFSILILSTILWSGSRAAYFGVFMGWLFILFYKRFNVKYLYTFLFSTIVSIYFSTLFSVKSTALGFFSSYHRSINGSPNQISSSRLDLYNQIFNNYLIRPIWGYGGEAIRNLNIMLGDLKIGQAHNAILQILIEYGFLGVLVVLVVLVFILIKILKIFHQTQFFCLVMLVNIIFSAFLNGGAYYIIILGFFTIFLSLACVREKNDV